MNPKFSVTVGGKDYADGWERTFAPKPENGHGVGDQFPGEDFPSYVINVNVEPQQSPEAIAAKTKQALLSLLADDDAPVRLRDYQKRQQAWAEHNFPLKPNAEHRRIAAEFLADRGVPPLAITDPATDLADLLAARDHRSYRPLLGVVEEVGELCHAHLKNEQGIRGTPEEWEAKKKDAIGDVLIYLLDYCSREGLDVEECLETAWAEVSQRDWIRFPGDGRTK